MSYRIEASKTKQAGCQNKPCKDEGIKIQKGELRFGSWVVVHEHGSFRWRHWGCVSGKVLENLREYLEQGDPDTGYKWDYFDGLDELEPSDQEKVKKAVIEGKIADEDWKGDPEFNVLGQSGTVKKAPRKKKARAGEEDDDDEADTSPDPPKKGRGKKAKAEGDDEEEDVKPAKKPRAKTAKIEVEEETKPVVKRGKVKTEIKDENDDDHSVPAPKPKSRARRAVKNEPLSGDEEMPVQKVAAKRGSKKEAASSDAEVNMDDIPHKNGSAKNGVKAEAKSDDEQEDIKPSKAAPKKTPSRKTSKASVKTENGDDEVEDVKPAKAAATKNKPAPKKVKKEESENESEEAEGKPAVPSRADRAAKRAASDLNQDKKPAKKSKASAEGKQGRRQKRKEDNLKFLTEGIEMIRLSQFFELGHAETVIRNLIAMHAEREEAGAFESNSDEEDDAEDNLDEDLDDGSGNVVEPDVVDNADNDNGSDDWETASESGSDSEASHFSMGEPLRFGEYDNADGFFTPENDLYGIRNPMQRVLAQHEAPEICCAMEPSRLGGALP